MAILSAMADFLPLPFLSSSLSVLVLFPFDKPSLIDPSLASSSQKPLLLGLLSMEITSMDHHALILFTYKKGKVGKGAHRGRLCEES